MNRKYRRLIERVLIDLFSIKMYLEGNKNANAVCNTLKGFMENRSQ